MSLWQAPTESYNEDEPEPGRPLYDVVVQGCDETTLITTDLSPTELALLTELAVKITAASEFSCMPTMTVQPHLHDEDCTEDHQ